jgi:hypothetical protein
MTSISTLLSACLYAAAMIMGRERHGAKIATIAKLSQFQAPAGGYLGHAG